MFEGKVKMLALTVTFGGLAVVLSFMRIPMPPFGDLTIASTPISIVSIIASSPAGSVASIIKGVGISMWTGDWFMELPVGAGDAMMATLTGYLAKRKVKFTYAVAIGQLSRYLFTSGMVALYIGTIVTTGAPSPLGGDVIGKFNRYALQIGFPSITQSFLLCMAIVWLARFPSMTLSILANTLVSVFVVKSAEKQLRKFASYFTEDIDAQKQTRQ